MSTFTFTQCLDATHRRSERNDVNAATGPIVERHAVERVDVGGGLVERRLGGSALVQEALQAAPNSSGARAVHGQTGP